MTQRSTGLQQVCIIWICHDPLQFTKPNYISLVLHPKHKLKYFEKQGWEKDWVKTAEEIVWRNSSEIMKNTLLTNWRCLRNLKERSASIDFLLLLLFQAFSSPKTTAAQNQRAHHQAPMRRTLQMSLTGTSHLVASRELTIRSDGGTRTKLAILICLIWQRIILQFQVSILSAFQVELILIQDMLNRIVTTSGIEPETSCNHGQVL